MQTPKKSEQEMRVLIYTHVSFDSSIVWYLLKQISLLDTKIFQRKKAVTVQETELENEKKWMVCIEKIYFFFAQIWNVIYSNGGCWLYFAPTIFFLVIFLFCTHLWCWFVAFGVTAEKNRTRKFFLICACKRICGKMGNDFFLYNMKYFVSVLQKKRTGCFFRFMSLFFSTLFLLFVVTYGDWQIFMFVKLKSS